MTLSDALKAARRAMYKYGNIHVLVIVQKPRQVNVLFDEVRALMEASSMRVESIRATAAERAIHVGTGSIRIAAVEDTMDAYLHVGRKYQRFIWLYEPQEKIENFMLTMLATDNPEVLVTNDRAEW